MAGRREVNTFGKRDMRRIARVVRDAERGDRDMSAPVQRTSDDGTEIVRGTFSGNWAKGSTKTVTNAVLTGVTYEAKNYFATISPADSMTCLISFVAGEWVLAAWDWHSLPSYDATKQQVLSHAANGGLAWVNTTACT